MEESGDRNRGHVKTEINWDKLNVSKFYVVGAGIFTGITVALYPVSVIKTRLQVASKDVADRSAYSIVKGILKADGVSGLYRGFGTVITGAVPARIIFLTALETTKVATFQMVEPFKLSEPIKAAIANGIAGMAASLCSQSVFVPINVVLGHENKSTAKQVAQNLIKEDGWKGLYRGLGPQFFSTSAWGTSMILAYEYLNFANLFGASSKTQLPKLIVWSGDEEFASVIGSERISGDYESQISQFIEGYREGSVRDRKISGPSTIDYMKSFIGSRDVYSIIIVIFVIVLIRTIFKEEPLTVGRRDPLARKEY